MTHPSSLNDFLARNRIDPNVWKKSSINWELLQAIASDHESQVDRLRDSAELFARVIQRFPSVHSVRWRVKNTEHLLEKIVRKRSEGEGKYLDINAENYFEIVTDLIGLRALHLFKDDCFTIYEDITRNWTASEPPTAYVREGDPQDLTNRFREHSFEVKEHPAGYRSVHYVCSTQPLQRKVFVEIQVRTIFEEGWSEIDHRVRYPNYSNDQLVAYFLTIFNRLAGSADEMGTFVQSLTGALSAFDLKLTTANQQKEEALTAMENVLAELEAKKKQGADTDKSIAALQQEVVKLRRLTSTNYIFGDDRPTGLASLVGLDSKTLLADLSRIPTMAEALRLANLTAATDPISKAIDGAGLQNGYARFLKDAK